MRLLPFCLAVAWIDVASAHHSFAGVYDSARDVSLERVVTEFLFVHPHPVLVVSVSPADGPKESWRAEMDNRFELAEIGVAAQTFKPGDRVRITGSPGRKEPRIMYLRRLERASDGLLYEQVGSTPRIERR